MFPLRPSRAVGFVLQNSENKVPEKVSCDKNLNTLWCFGNERSEFYYFGPLYFEFPSSEGAPMVELTNCNISHKLAKHSDHHSVNIQSVFFLKCSQLCSLLYAVLTNPIVETKRPLASACLCRESTPFFTGERFCNIFNTEIVKCSN